MLQPGEYADVLRVIGRWLDQQGAQNIEIIDQGEYIHASWDAAVTRRGPRLFRAFDLAHLRSEARVLRAGPQGVPSVGMAETLRVLGNELDQSGMELLSIRQTSDGFRLSAADGGRHESNEYSLEAIQQCIEAQRAERGTESTQPGETPRSELGLRGRIQARRRG